MNEDSSLARKTARLATSEGSAKRAMGVRLMTPWMSSSGRLSVMAVRMAPGQMALTRMPLAAYSAAAVLVSMRTAPLAAQ